MIKWRKNGIFLAPLFKFKCLGCRDTLATFYEMGYGLSNFPIDMDKPEDYNSYALDRTYRCNLCGWEDVFGLALTKEHFEEILNYDEKKSKRQIT